MRKKNKTQKIYKGEPTVYLFKKMWKFAGKDRKWIIIYVLMFLVSNIITLFNPIILGKLLDEVQANGIHNNFGEILTIIWIWGLLTLTFWLFHGPARIIENLVAFKIMQYYREYLLSNILKLNISWHTDRDSGETIDKVGKATEAIHSFAGSTFVTINIVVSIIGTTIAMYLYHPLLSFLVPIFIFFGFFVIRWFDNKLVTNYFNLNKLYNKTSARIFDTISNITSIKALHIEKHTFKRIKKFMWRPFKLYKSTYILNEVKWFSSSFVVTVLTLLSMGIYLYYSRNNIVAISIGSIAAVYSYLSRLNSVIDGFAWRYGTIIRERTNVTNVEDIENSFSEEDKRIIELPKWTRIELVNVIFKYKDSKEKKPHIKLNMTFEENEKIALIGESGSGKTTFLKVLHGMYPEAKCTIKINEKSFETNFADLSLKTALVPQEPEIFSSSIRDNITLGMRAKDNEIMKVVELAKFTSVLKKLPKGLEAKINEKGVNLSGGEKQRLALARALFFSNNKEVVLLDESTSSVDAETEVEIYHNIFKHFKDSVIFASIHKMNLLKYFDRIIIFDKGKIVDEGKFEDLLIRNKQFKKNWEEYVAKEL